MFNSQNESLHMAVMYHGVAMLPKLRRMSAKELMIVMHEAEEHSAHAPLHLCDGEKRFTVNSWSDSPLSGAQVIALLVYGLWVSVGENEELASGLLSDWSEIKLAVALAKDS
jgi:hypothetical protein